MSDSADDESPQDNIGALLEYLDDDLAPPPPSAVRSPILTDPDDSGILRRLLTNLPLIIERLGDPTAWAGVHVSEGNLEP